MKGTMMIKDYFLTIVALGLLPLVLVAASCGNTTITGSGNVVTEFRPISGFTGFSFSGEGELNITQGSTESLSITTDDNLMEYIETSVRGGILTIEFRDGVQLDPSNGITYDIAVIELNSITFSGAGSITAASLDVAADTFSFSVSGAVECSIAGQVDSQNIAVSGTLTCDAPDFQCSDATVDISGVGNITLWATSTLDVTISGVGDVYYWGSPTTTTNISGVGNVQNLGPK
jgi:hypothetical protein